MRAWIRSIAVLAAVVAAPTLSAQAATKPAKTTAASSAPAATTPAPATQAAKTTPAAPQQAKSADAKAAPKPAMVDINKATEAELEALPGIGKALAPKIVAGRPYAKKSDLVSKKILTQATYDKVKGHIVAHQ